MSDYITKAKNAEIINEGDALSYNPGNIADANFGYEVDLLSSTLNSRLQFTELPSLSGNNQWSGSNSFDEISYSDTYWDDLRVSANTVKVQGESNNPTWDTLVGNLQMLWFDKNTMEQVFFEIQLPHRYKVGSNISPHVHWVPKANGGAGHVVSWGLEYVWASIGETFSGTSTTIYGNAHTPSADTSVIANRHYLTSLTDIIGTGKGFSSMLICRLFRNATGGGDSADTYDDDAGLLEFDVHFEIDSPGTREEFIK